MFESTQFFNASAIAGATPLTSLPTAMLFAREGYVFARLRLSSAMRRADWRQPRAAQASRPAPVPVSTMQPWGTPAVDPCAARVRRRMGTLYIAIGCVGFGVLAFLLGMLAGQRVADGMVVMTMAMLAMVLVATCCVLAAVVSLVEENRLSEESILGGHPGDVGRDDAVRHDAAGMHAVPGSNTVVPWTGGPVAPGSVARNF